MQSLEILIATMFRTDFSFLEEIFSKNKHFSNYNILIVNQTNEDKLLHSDYDNIRVINSYERGSPASRNLAIRNAKHDICLMADDDIVYEEGFDTTILKAYEAQPQASFISFEAVNEHGGLYANYPSRGKHTKSSLRTIYTIVISFKRELFKEHQVYFNHFFGVGSLFKGETEIMFLRNAFDKGLPMYHENKTIVMHADDSSGRHLGSDEAFYARSAAACRFYGNLSYIWLLKYTLFTLRKGYITIGEFISKMKIGMQGISKYKSLARSGEIDKIHGD